MKVKGWKPSATSQPKGLTQLISVGSAWGSGEKVGGEKVEEAVGSHHDFITSAKSSFARFCTKMFCVDLLYLIVVLFSVVPLACCVPLFIHSFSF